eukprot:scaffold1169_cov120-Cylindrotheca_fusiformis.AAC.26
MALETSFDKNKQLAKQTAHMAACILHWMPHQQHLVEMNVVFANGVSRVNRPLFNDAFRSDVNNNGLPVDDRPACHGKHRQMKDMYLYSVVYLARFA